MKTLFVLDSEIEFSPNELFWINLDLISKISSFKQSTQLDAIKIMPFIYPFTYRLQILNSFNREYRLKQLNILQESLMEMDHPNIQTDFRISRSNMYDHSFQYFLEGKFNPFIRWKITFINEFGHAEEGVDAGGLFKEYIYKLSEKAFSPDEKMFLETSSGFLMPNPDAEKISSMYLSIFEFLGFITGKAILDEINIWPNFSNFFLNNILDIENSFNELKNYDTDLFKNLVYLKDYQGDVEADFGLDFTLNENRYGKTQLVELIEGGKNISVTNNNKLLYIKKVAQYKLYSQIKPHCDSFKKGLLQVFDSDGLKIFTSNELRQIITGLDKPIDISDLKSYAVYNGWNFNNPQDAANISNFWKILEEFDAKEREKFLFFVTSLKRPPLVGFKALNPKFTIAKSDKEVPTASTCTNMLLLPVLPKEKLRTILKYVINADAGFYYG